MINHEPFFEHIERTYLKKWVPHFRQILENEFEPERHGDFERWNSALEQLPNIGELQADFSGSAITVESEQPLTEQEKASLTDTLLTLHPWRKGPFSIAGIEIDTEWRSDWKWDRVLPHISPLKHRKILDVGCGSGYHMWRMCAEEPSMVVGIDPSLIFMMQ